MEVSPPPATDVPVREKKHVLRFGRVPYGAYGDMIRDHQELLDYMGGGLGREVTLQLFKDYADMVRAIRAGELDLAWLGPLAYLQAEETIRAPLKIVPIVKPVRHGASAYVSEIIVRKDSGIDTIAHLRGKRMAFVDTESTAGYLLATAHLVRSGISVHDPLLTRKHFVNHYGNVVLAVLFGKFEAGAVFEGAPGVFLKNSEKPRRDELMVLTRSDPVPYEPVAAVFGERISVESADRLRALFLNLSEKPEILKRLQVDGFAEARAEEYRPIRLIMNTVKQTEQENADHVR